jgi:tripartite-type tricarboxylate transporter receptor subunit TctC
MRTPRRRFLQEATSAATLAALPHTAWALDYPTRPIHWIIGFPPGGGADIVARIVGAWLSERLGQQIIIENRPGAATNIATQAVINSPPDGCDGLRNAALRFSQRHRARCRNGGLSHGF